VSRRVGLVAFVVAIATTAGGVAASPAGARVRTSPDLPPANRGALARMFDPQLERLGLHTTRAALQDSSDYEPSATGTHLAIYVEPITPGTLDGDAYARNIMRVARVFLPSVFRRWSGLKSFDVCQEPDRDPRAVPPPATQVIATRRGAAAVRWKHATLATLIARAHTIRGRHGGADPLSLYVAPQILMQPRFQAALRDAETSIADVPKAPVDAG
jgi:hypothetical protein